MSRPLGAYGFRSSHNMAGGTSGRMGGIEYEINPTYTTQIMSGDLVKRSGDGRYVERAAAGETVIGVFKGCTYLHPDGEIIFRDYWPANQATQANSKVIANVEDGPNDVFMAQMDGALTEAQIGQLADLVQVSEGNTLSGTSGQAVDSGTVGSGSQVKILGLSPKYASNSTYGNQNDVLVQLADHELHTRAAV